MMKVFELVADAVLSGGAAFNLFMAFKMQARYKAMRAFEQWLIADYAVQLRETAEVLCPFCQSLASPEQEVTREGEPVMVEAETDNMHVVVSRSGGRDQVPCLGAKIRELANNLVDIVEESKWQNTDPLSKK